MNTTTEQFPLNVPTTLLTRQQLEDNKRFYAFAERKEMLHDETRRDPLHSAKSVIGIPILLLTLVVAALYFFQ